MFLGICCFGALAFVLAPFCRRLVGRICQLWLAPALHQNLFVLETG